MLAILDEPPYLLMGLAIGVVAVIYLLLYRLRRIPIAEMKNFWDFHASLNAISKLGAQAETGKKINVELIYMLGEHLKSTAVTQQHNGWLDARQLSEWIQSVVGLHCELHQQGTGEIQVEVKFPTGIRRLDTQKLASAILMLLHEEVPHRITIEAKILSGHCYGYKRRRSRVSLQVELMPLTNNHLRPKPRKPWREIDADVLLYVGDLSFC